MGLDRGPGPNRAVALLSRLGFVADIRRINVAITRARKKLIVIGDGATIARHPFFDGFLKYAQEIGAWCSAWERG